MVVATDRARAASPVNRDPDLALLLTAAAVLHENGQSTLLTIETVDRLARHLGRDILLRLDWDGVVIEDAADVEARPRLHPCQPSAVNMRRVAAAMAGCEAAIAGRLDRAALAEALARAARLPASSDLAFAGAAMLGAVALALIFGAQHPVSMALIALAAGAGALLRRWMGRHGMTAVAQVLAAALLAGLMGALADHLDLTSAQRLVAVCPCMILVPGPHILNGSLDLVAGRIPLALARLGHAGVLLFAISIGVVAGLMIGGSSLPPEVPVGAAGLWRDVAAAAAAALAYSVFFSAPPRMFIWPVAVGALAHGARWLAIHQAGADMAAASGLACLIVGAILAPVAWRRQLPFAAAGFAAVVALVPGLFAFRAVSAMVEMATASDDLKPGLVQVLVSDLATFLLTTVAMVAGLLLPLAIAQFVFTRRQKG